MKKLFCLLLLIYCLIYGQSYGQTVTQTADSYGSDYESITVSSTALGVTGSKVGSMGLFLTVETDQIRVRWDGTNPTSTEGHLLNAGDSLLLRNRMAASKLKMIRVTSDATVKVTHLSQ